MSKPNGKCAEVSLKVRNIGSSQACYSGAGQNGYINLIIDNTGNIDISGLVIWIIGEKGTKLLDFNGIPIKRGELLSIEDNSVKYDDHIYGPIKEIRIFPKVKIQGSSETCEDFININKFEVC